ncbi:MAG TPA: ABC transporter ATP-binding protein [Longimicrobium sp.]|nr:ABC transporter ATP-binding protein [Longimicrobium sp.]
MSGDARGQVHATERAFAAEVWRLHRKTIVPAICLSLLSPLAEAAGVMALVPLLGAVGFPGAAGGAGKLGAVMTELLRVAGLRPGMGTSLGLFVAVTTAQALVLHAQSISAWRLQMEVSLQARRRLYAAIAGARWLHFTRIRSSDLLQALTTECDRCGSAANQLLYVFTVSLVSAAYFALALNVSATASLVAAGCGGVLLLALRGYNRGLRMHGEGFSTAHREMTAAAGEHLQSMKVVKSYGAEERNAALFGAASEHAATVQMAAARAYGDSRALFTVGSVVLLALVTWVAVAGLRLPVTSAVLLAYIFFRLAPRLQNLQNAFQMLQHDLPAWEGVSHRIAELEAERERLSPSAAPHALTDGIRFDGVRFAYPDVEREAVAGVDLCIRARETTAVVGPSGSGKTTVADLVMGLVRPSEGRVVVDGRELDEGWMRGWRQGIGYVAQDTVLFHDSVRQNLLWAHPEAPEEELWDALRAAAADGFVSALPEGLETVVGDRGVRLSGGERQRLALARALLRRPALLILDEATSALDTENERRIREATQALHGRVTILLITHRLSSVRDADTIYVMEAGRLVESGDWASLVEKPGGRFRALWTSQEAEL